MAERLRKEYRALQRSLRVVGTGQDALADATGDKVFHRLLTDAVKELPPGEVRAFVQIEVERTYGSMRARKGPAHPPHNAAHHDALVAEGLHHLQAILRLVHEADANEREPEDAANELRHAILLYTRFIERLPDERRTHVEEGMLAQYAA